MIFIGCIVIGYFIGSIPTGYILLKWKRNIDLRRAGSGNVGAMNAFEVSGSRALGIGVLLVDAAKGASAVLIARLLFGEQFPAVASAAVGAVLGHNYPVWLRGKGGRGLATGAGALFVVGWVVPLLWILFWLIAYGIARHIHIANIVATIITPIAVALLPVAFLRDYLPFAASRFEWIILTSLICLLILLRHIGPIREMWKSQIRSSHTET